MFNKEQSKKLRNDITGLRAIAVISVVIFHFSKEILPGGFAGVDIFFVISGYLMTSIIFGGVEKNNFNYIRFIKSRAERILPALFAVLMLVLILGYVFIAPAGYKEIAKHSLASSVFVSNILYSLEAGYFDTASESKFLLHTWSLSVEWQFYLIYPLAILFLKKITTIRNMRFIILIATFVFFLLSLYLSSTNKTSAYFSIHSRAWEMLVGGLAFIYPINYKKRFFIKLSPNKVELSGLALIAVGLFYINEAMLWPGYVSLLPVLGAYFCLLANNDKSFLDNVAFKNIGLWSYSIYLLHWPILVFSKQVNIGLSLKAYLISVVLLSFIFYSIVERRKCLKYELIACFFLVFIFSLVVFYTNGSSSRISKKFQLNKDQLYEKYYGGSAFKEANGHLTYLKGEAGGADIILAGDSYSLQYLKYFSGLKSNTASVAHTSCLINRDYTTRELSSCGMMYDILIKAISENKKADVVINQNWSAYQKSTMRTSDKSKVPAERYAEVVMLGLNQILSSLSDGQRLFVVGTYSYPGYDVWQCLSRRELLGGKLSKKCKLYSENDETPMDSELRKFAELHDNVFFISPRESLCNRNGCVNYIDDLPIHFDGDHLSVLGAGLVGGSIYSLINKAAY